MCCHKTTSVIIIIVCIHHIWMWLNCMCDSSSNITTETHHKDFECVHELWQLPLNICSHLQSDNMEQFSVPWRVCGDSFRQGWLMLLCQHVNQVSWSRADGLIDGIFNREHNPRWVPQCGVVLLLWNLYLCFYAFVCAPKVNHWHEWAAFVNLTMTIQLCWW